MQRTLVLIRTNSPPSSGGNNDLPDRRRLPSQRALGSIGMRHQNPLVRALTHTADQPFEHLFGDSLGEDPREARIESGSMCHYDSQIQREPDCPVAPDRPALASDFR